MPILGMVVCTAMIVSLDSTTLLTAFGWMLIGLMVYSFARIGVALGMKVEDVFAQKRRLWVRLRRAMSWV